MKLQVNLLGTRVCMWGLSLGRTWLGQDGAARVNRRSQCQCAGWIDPRLTCGVTGTIRLSHVVPLRVARERCVCQVREDPET